MLRVWVTRIVDAEFWNTRSSSRTHFSGSGEKKGRSGAGAASLESSEYVYISASSRAIGILSEPAAAVILMQLGATLGAVHSCGRTDGACNSEGSNSGKRSMSA